MKSFPLILLLAVAGGTASRAQQQPWMQPKPPVYHLIDAPKAGDVTSVSGNMMMLDWGTGELNVNLRKERVLEFLTNGEAHAVDEWREKWFELADFTVPDKMIKDPRLHFDAQLVPHDREYRAYNNECIRAEGVLVTRQHAIYFWTLWNDRVLFLSDNSGGACLLVLGPDAETSAPYLELYYDYTKPLQAQALEGALPRPKAADVVAFINRSDSLGIRFQVSRKRVMRFLTRGTLSVTWRGGDPLVIRPETLDIATMQRIGNDDSNMAGLFAHANGVIAMRDGEVIFWSQPSDLVLSLCDSQHRTCMLQLGKMPEPDSQGLAPIYVSYSLGGRVYRSLLPARAVLRGPDWTPTAPPPLSTEKALKIAWRELAKIAREKSMSAWRVAGITFIPLDHRDSPHYPDCRKWCYQVNFIKPVNPGETGLPPSMPPAGFQAKATVYVSMDGTPGKIEELVDAED